MHNHQFLTSYIDTTLCILRIGDDVVEVHVEEG